MKQVVNIMMSKTYTIPGFVFENFKKLKLNEKELIVLIYLINNQGCEYNPKEISNVLSIKIDVVLDIMNTLEEKGFLSVKMENDNNVRTQKIDLTLLYEKCSYLMESTNINKSDIYSKYEKELKRELSPMEYEIITRWLEDYSEEIILLGLKEAIYNGTTNFRYIDRIIYEWKLKNLKTEKDIIEYRKKYKKASEKEEIFDCDWLNEK